MVVLTAGVLALAAAPAVAAADFAEPMPITPPGADSVDVAMDADGDATVAWRLNGRLQTRRVLANGMLTPVVGLGPIGSVTGVATDSEGNSIVVWTDESDPTVRTRRISADGVRGPTVRVAEGAYGTGVGMAADGDAVVTWQDLDDRPRIHARTMPATGGRGPVLDVSPPAGYTDGGQIATSRAGRSIVCWHAQRNHQAVRVIEARTISPAGALDPVHVLSSPDEWLFGCDPAIAPNGAAIVLMDGFDETGDFWKVAARHLFPGQVLGPELTVAQGYQLVGTALTTWDDGDAIVGFSGFDIGAAGAVRTISDADVMGPARSLPWSPGVASQFPFIATDARGRSVVTATHYADFGDDNFDVRWAAPNGALTDPVVPGEALSAGVVASLNGRALLHWTNPGSGRVMVALGSTAPPD